MKRPTFFLLSSYLGPPTLPPPSYHGQFGSLYILCSLLLFRPSVSWVDLTVREYNPSHHCGR